MIQRTQSALRSASTVLTLLLAFVSVFSAIFPLTDWSDLARATLTYYVVLLFGGIVLLAAGVLAMFSRRWQAAAFFVGGIASLALLANQVTGLHLQSILCHTPS